MALTQISTQGIKDGTITGTDLATNVDLVDNQKLRLGSSNDLEIYHSSSNAASYIQNSTGNLFIEAPASAAVQLRKKGTAEVLLKAIPDGAVELYFDNSKKFQTYLNGIQFFGNIKNETDGTNQGLFLGAANDLQMYHDGNRSAINNRVGELRVSAADNIRLGYAAAGNTTSVDENYAVFKLNGAVELFYDNSKKFETHSGGVKLLGSGTDAIEMTGDVWFNNNEHAGSDIYFNSGDKRLIYEDNVKAVFGGGGDLKIYSDGTNGILEGGGSGGNAPLFLNANTIRLQTQTGGEKYINCQENGAVEIYHNNVKKMETTNVGVSSLDTLITHGEIRPASDNNHSIGRSNRRYITYFGVNGSINTSDKNEKNTIIDSDLGLDFINKLKPISYKWNKDDGKTHYGLIAQDLEETLTSLGKTIADFGGIYKEDESPMGLGYSELIAPLIKAVQELSAEVAALKSG